MCLLLNNYSIQVEKSTHLSYVAMAIHGTSHTNQYVKCNSDIFDVNGHHFVNMHSFFLKLI